MPSLSYLDDTAHPARGQGLQTKTTAQAEGVSEPSLLEGRTQGGKEKVLSQAQDWERHTCSLGQEEVVNGESGQQVPPKTHEE